MILETAGSKTAADLAEIEKILAGGGRFFCEIYKCNMLRSACIERQKNAESVKGKGMPYGRFRKPGMGDFNCGNCEQGRGIQKSGDRLKKENDMTEKQEPYEKVGRSEGEENQAIDALIERICREEGASLEQIKQRDPGGKLRPVKVKLAQGLKLKGLTGKEIANRLGIPRGSINSYINDIVPNSGKKKQKKSASAKSTKIEDLAGPKSQADMSKNDHTLTIDFSEHIHTLESIKEIAKSEIRTPENQVLYWLSTFSIIIKKEVEDD